MSSVSARLIWMSLATILVLAHVAPTMAYSDKPLKCDMNDACKEEIEKAKNMIRPMSSGNCCNEKCSTSSDCASGLFCCPNLDLCMDVDTASTVGQNCVSCGGSAGGGKGGKGIKCNDEDKKGGKMEGGSGGKGGGKGGKGGESKDSSSNVASNEGNEGFEDAEASSPGGKGGGKGGKGSSASFDSGNDNDGFENDSSGGGSGAADLDEPYEKTDNCGGPTEAAMMGCQATKQDGYRARRRYSYGKLSELGGFEEGTLCTFMAQPLDNRKPRFLKHGRCTFTNFKSEDGFYYCEPDKLQPGDVGYRGGSDGKDSGSFTSGGKGGKGGKGN